MADRMTSTTKFQRRVNDDGTFDSLCTSCFRTVAFAMKESHLAELERNHTCEGRSMPHGLSASMLIEESRVFEVATFGALQLHQSELDQNQVLLDVKVIADEADAQLAEALRTFMEAKRLRHVNRGRAF